MGMHHKALTRESALGLKVFDTSCVELPSEPRGIQDYLKNVDRIKSFSEVLENALGAIQTLPKLFFKKEKKETKYLLIFFGITILTQLIFKRWLREVSMKHKLFWSR